MATTSGIRATGSGSGEYVMKIVLKKSASSEPLKAEITSILDPEDCWDIVNGSEFESDAIAEVEDPVHQDDGDKRAEAEKRQTEIKDSRKRMKKAASLNTHILDNR